MTISLMYAAGCEYWEWQVSPTDETGQPVDPTPMPVEFAAVSAELVPAATWPAVLAQSAGHASGSWQGPDQIGRWTARVLLSGTGGGGDIALPPGTYRLLVQVTASPERPVEDTGTLILR